VLEVLGGVTALGLFFVYGLTGEGVLYLFVLAALLCIFLNIVIFVLGILSGFLFPHISWLDRGIGLVAISVPMFLLTLLVPHAFGGGDVKLMGVAGVLLGWQALLVAFFIGLVIGGAQGVYILRVQKRDKKTLFAFGPALAIGIAISLFFGHNIIDWYIRLLF
jgi:leader peptidase (prepilin peptidase)/N-methyltransferase